jgi:hypothetical protein
MPRQKRKICLYCYKPFKARRDAKTCSDRCRKSFQRARDLYHRETQRIEQEADYSLSRHTMIAQQRNYYAER